jgi:hypothetical protein
MHKCRISTTLGALVRKDGWGGKGQRNKVGGWNRRSGPRLSTTGSAVAPGGLTLHRAVLKNCRRRSRLRSRVVFRLGCLGWTLKASRIIAQDERSGEAAKCNPGLRLETSVATLKGLRDARWNPCRVQRVAPIATQGSRCAATLGSGMEPLRGSPLWGWHRRRGSPAGNTPSYGDTGRASGSGRGCVAGSCSASATSAGR